MTDSTPTYRPHNKGHDYYAPGIYLITLVTRDRIPYLGQLNNDPSTTSMVSLPKSAISMASCDG